MAGKSGQRKGKTTPRKVAGPRRDAVVTKPLKTVEVEVKARPGFSFGSTWVGQVWKRVWRKQDGDGMKEHLDAVKAGVMHELESLSAEKGVKISASPFSNVVLPQIKRRRPWFWPLIAATALVLIVLMVMVGRKPVDPTAVWHQVVIAVENRDVATFDKRVDVSAVASSVVNQIFSAPVDVQGMPQEIQEKLRGGMGARMTAFIKPGLADELRDEILQAVRDGHVASADSDNLLARLWQDVGGENVRLGKMQIAMQDRTTVVAEVPVERVDLGLTLPLQVVFNHGRDGWEVADVPNLAAVLDTLAATERKRAQRVEGQAAAAVDGKVVVSEVRKAKAEVDGLLLTMEVSNVSDGDVHDLQLKVTFGDAAGQPLKVADLVVDGTLRAHEKREQTWTVAIDRSKAVERYVLDLPLSALSVKVVPLGGQVPVN